MTSKTIFVSLLMILSGCASQPAVKADLMVARKPEQLKNCQYISNFRMNFASDGVPMTAASKSEQLESNKGFRAAVAAGANTIFRVEEAPAPLVKVNAYRCNPNDLIVSK